MEERDEMGFLESQYLAAKVTTLFSMHVAPLLLAEHQQMLTFYTHCLSPLALGGAQTPKGKQSRAPGSYELASFS